MKGLSNKIINNIIGGGIRRDSRSRNRQNDIKIGDNLKFTDELGGINYGVVVGFTNIKSNPYEVKDTSGNIVLVNKDFIIGKA